jgi:CHAD domain-containing protein
LDEKDRKHRAGIERLLLRLRQGRDALQPEIIGTLDKLDKNGTLAEMYGELGKALFTLRSHNVPLSSARVYELAGAHMRKRKDDLLAREHALGDPDDVRGHHQLRIAAKRLRYTLEICEPAYDQQLAPFIKAAKRVQSLLGDIHDCDVWAENIEQFMEQERASTIAYFGHSRPFNRLKPGLLLIRDERQAHRRDVFAELLDYWKGLEAEHLWDVLEQRLQSRMGTSDPLCHEPKNGQTDVGNEEIEKDRSAE